MVRRRVVYGSARAFSPKGMPGTWQHDATRPTHAAGPVSFVGSPPASGPARLTWRGASLTLGAR